MTEASIAFEELPSNVIDERLIQTLSLLPVECLRGQTEAILTLLVLSMAKYLTETCGKQLLARTFFNGFRTSGILKYLSINTVVEAVMNAPLDISKDQTYCLTSLKAIFKAGVTYTKPLEEIVANLPMYSQPLELLSDQKKVFVSICLLESVKPILTTLTKPVSATPSGEDSRKEKCEAIFQALSKALLKGLKSKSVDLEPNFVVSGLSVVIDVQCCKSDNLKQLKKLAGPINEYVSYCAATYKEQPSSLIFLSTVLTNYAKLKEGAVTTDIFGKFLKSDIHRKPLETVTETSFLKLLLQVTSEQDSELFTKVLDEMVVATHEAKDLEMLTNWTAFAMTKIGNEDMLALRKKYFVQILSLLRPLMLPESKFSQKSTKVNQFSHFYWPMLELHQALLDSDKPILSKEAEGFIVAQSLNINLSQIFLDNDTGTGSSENFLKCWKGIYKVLSNAFHKRSSSLVSPRIPLIMAGLRNLLASLALAGSQKRNLEPSDLKEVVNLSYNFDRLCEHVKKMKEEFARVSPYLIADVMEAFQKVTLYPSVRTNVLHGVHKLLDICDTHSIDYLSSVLPTGKQEMFKHLFSNYKQYHRYAGRV